MPVIRFPNFTDRTGDIPADRFFVRVGNEHAGQRRSRSVPLTDVLKNLKAFASLPSSIRGSGNLLAPRDTHFLVSAQAVFLPIPEEGQGRVQPGALQLPVGAGLARGALDPRHAAGHEHQVIENKPGETLGRRGRGPGALLQQRRSARRLHRRAQERRRGADQAQGGPKTEDDRSALQKGADVLFLVQVPLVHANQGVLGGVMPSPPRRCPRR